MESNNQVRIMVIDEQPLFRAGVRQTLEQAPDFEIIENDQSRDTLEQIEADMPDVVLLGSDLATQGGLELGRAIVRHFPSTKVIILSPNPSDEDLFEAIKTAAVACLKKSTSATDLMETIRRALRGEYPINETVMTNPSVARQVLDQFQDENKLAAIANIVAPLTQREKQILNHVANGHTNKQIANLLLISEQTIKNHVSAILRKLNANDRAHAVVVAIRCGWITV